MKKAVDAVARSMLYFLSRTAFGLLVFLAVFMVVSLVYITTSYLISLLPLVSFVHVFAVLVLMLVAFGIGVWIIEGCTGDS